MEPRPRTVDVAGLPVHLWHAGDAPVLYLHGVPNTGRQWRPFLVRSGGVAPDLPGFGQSGKPGDFDYSIEGYGRFLEELCTAIGLERMSLVLHDWGGVGLAFAQRFPERIERLVLINCVPFLPDYRWHRVARAWRTPVVGELTMGFTFKFALRRGTGLPDELVDEIWGAFDHGTQRAILKLYRSAPESALARAGERLGEVRSPALVIAAEDDPYIPADFGTAYAEALGGEAEVELTDGGHWTWVGRPELVDRVVEFLP